MSVLEGTFAAARPRQLVRRSEQRALIIRLIVTDAIVVALSFALAYAIRFWFGRQIFEIGSIRPLFYVFVIGALIPGYLALFQIYGLYDRTNLLGGTTEYARVFNAVTSGLVLILFVNFIQPEFVVARAWLLLAWLLMIAFGIASRFLMRRLVYWQRQDGAFLDRTLIVGANPEGTAVATQLLQARSSGAQIVGFVGRLPGAGQRAAPWCSGAWQLGRVCSADRSRGNRYGCDRKYRNHPRAAAEYLRRA